MPEIGCANLAVFDATSFEWSCEGQRRSGTYLRLSGRWLAQVTVTGKFGQQSVAEGWSELVKKQNGPESTDEIPGRVICSTA
jgi:hypothetical protein